jgi:transcription elongation factor GreA
MELRLSQAARRSLRQRLRVLEEDRIPRLEADLAASGDPVTEMALRAARDEASRVREALAAARPLEELPDDPTLVELGDTVTIRAEGSRERERYTLVGELEARLDDSWISITSPMGSALLGRRAGEVVVVRTPAGEIRYEILGVRREDHSAA